MAHPEQRSYCESVKTRHPEYFQNVKVLDIGSMNVNGTNLYLFSDSEYVGVDIAPGENVSIVSKAHELEFPDGYFDTIISTECLEHDMYWDRTLLNALRMLRHGGLLLLTMATTGRAEHGTRRSSPDMAPELVKIGGAWADYYRNLTPEDLHRVLEPNSAFSVWDIQINDKTHDMYFMGIRH